MIARRPAAWVLKAGGLIVIAWFAAGWPLLGQEEFAGAVVCGSCHPAQLAEQSASGHARALARSTSHALAMNFEPAGVVARPPAFRFQYSRKPEELRVRAYDADNVMDIPLEWAFGAGEQAVTFVTRVNEDWYLEHSQSYYAAAQGFALTPGQAELTPTDLPQAMGHLYKTLDSENGIVGCFQCHSTGPVGVGPRNVLRPTELGVRCESCHGPGAGHAATGDPALIANPAKLDANQQNEFCGKCHRPPASQNERPDWAYVWNVRHQPLYLAESRCFTESEEALSCLTCHDPHAAARNLDLRSYDKKCLSCHQEGRPEPAAVCRNEQPSNCVSCHMPRVSPQPFLRFTNHWIGVYGEGAKLRPIP